MRQVKHSEVLTVGVLVLLFAAAPFVTGDEGWLYLAALIMTWSIFALGYDISFGLTGLLSFGHAAFFGMGAYAASWAMLSAGLPFSVGIVAAIGAGGLSALVFGFVGRRVSGLYFSLMTLMLAELISIVMTTRLRHLSGGVDGLPGVPRPQAFGIDFFNAANFYWVIFALFCLTLAFCAVLKSSPLGQALRGVRQNAVRSEQVGFNVGALRLTALTLSGCLSGLAGALLASLMMYVSPQLLGWKMSGDVVIMTLLGGSGTPVGPVIGVTLVELLREGLSATTEHWYGLLGVIFILCTIYLPEGVAGLGRKLWRR
ncbi:MAG: branched-chain amino acid ABC transporter permease [Xanthobacteraceae bacterium]|nr:branched-chain amino acid ABC transporter permease [Xanthobacteraceae bacterium]